MATRSRSACMLLTAFLALGACSQISETSADGAPTFDPPTDVDQSPTPGMTQDTDQDTSPDDQLQRLENPPPTLAATDDSTDSGGIDATSPDVDWITFELENFFDESHTVTAAIPAGWVPHEVFEDRWQPAEDTGHGFFTDIGFDQGCDGFCEAKDWEAALNAPNGQLSRARDEYVVLRDEPIDNGWILITEGIVVSHRVNVLRWNDDADFFFECRVELDEEDAQLVDEMVEICLLSDPLWLD